MNKTFHIVMIIVLVFIQSCKNKNTSTESLAAPLPIVTVIHPVKGTLHETEQINGQVVYLNKTIMTAPISGYVSHVNAKLGDVVKKGSRLFSIQTKESRALENSNIETSNQFGIIPIYASASGYINTLDVTDSGVFISEGSPLTTIVKSSDLAIQVNAPFQFSKLLNGSNNIIIELPNQEMKSASFYKTMPIVDPISQTQQILFKLNTYELLPENLNVLIKIPVKTKSDVMIIPKDAVLTNETQDEFWIMTITNDSLAVIVPIVKGLENDHEVEIVKPILKLTDKIIEKGGYGLPDSTKVKIN
tara:strand:- start:27916 stop:28824 length:909 start_codon:yes stop_codon:yes gene_type:complete